MMKSYVTWVAVEPSGGRGRLISKFEVSLVYRESQDSQSNTEKPWLTKQKTVVILAFLVGLIYHDTLDGNFLCYHEKSLEGSCYGGNGSVSRINTSKKPECGRVVVAHAP